MNLQAEGMSNVLEHNVAAHLEVSKSLGARTKGTLRSTMWFLKIPIQHLSTLKDLSFPMQWPCSSLVVQKLGFRAWPGESSSNRTEDSALCSCLSSNGIQKLNLWHGEVDMVSPRRSMASPMVCERQMLLTESSQINCWDEFHYPLAESWRI